ncbi:MAG: cobalamin-binding protein [Candidatus Bathyarchaeia archaeon]|jgi:iron complex transport system substrate-binding protein
MVDYCKSDTNCSFEAPKRVVSLSPSNTEILFAVGAGPNVVGVTDYCDYPTEINSMTQKGQITRVGGYWNPSIQTIVELKPDLVIVSTAKCTVKTNQCKTQCTRRCELTTKTAQQLKKLGINVLILAPHGLNDVFDQIQLIGNATGNSSNASVLVDNLRQRTETVTKKTKAIRSRPKVYFEVWNKPYISVNSKTWIGNLIRLAGGTNIFANATSEWPIIGPKEIIDQNPDVMVFPVIPNVPRFWESFEAVKKRSGWNEIAAVKNGRLFELSRDCISRPGPRLVDSLELLAQMIHLTS